MSDNVNLRSFSRVWKIERVIYRIEAVRLPFAVSIRQIGFFFLGFLIMFFASNLSVIEDLNPLLRMVCIPFGFAWFMTKYKFDGKAPHKYFWSLLNYRISPHWLSLYKTIQLHRKPLKFKAIVVCRKKSRRKVA